MSPLDWTITKYSVFISLFSLAGEPEPLPWSLATPEEKRTIEKTYIYNKHNNTPTMNKIGSKYQNLLAVFSRKCNKASQIFLDYSNLSGRCISTCFKFFFFLLLLFYENWVVFKQLKLSHNTNTKSKEQCFSFFFFEKKRKRERENSSPVQLVFSCAPLKLSVQSDPSDLLYANYLPP